MHISLTDQLEDYVNIKVQSGLYKDASEVVREALRLKISHQGMEETKLQKLRDATEPAWRQADNGELADYSLEKTMHKLKDIARDGSI